MKKIKLLTFLSLLSAVTLVGCSKTEQPTVTPSTPDSVTPSSGSSVKDISPDPYASVLEGLDKKKDVYSDAHRDRKSVV